MRLDCISMIEACYAPIQDDAAWLGNIVATMRPLVGELPAVALTFSFREEGFRVESVGLENLAMAALYEHMVAGWERIDPEFVRRWYAPTPAVDLASRRMASFPEAALENLRPFFESMGVRDALGLLAVEPDAHGIALTVPYVEPPRLSARTLYQLRRVTAHLGTALRLRRRARPSWSPADASVEAILEPSGNVQHASGAATDGAVRESLVRAVRDVERARGRLRETGPDEALSLWEGLVSGRWSMIDHVDSDGRRFVLLRRNEPGVRDPGALTPRERDVLAFVALGHSNKHVGYVLGLAPASVAAHLAAGMAKLGLASRREVISTLGAVVARAGRRNPSE